MVFVGSTYFIGTEKLVVFRDVLNTNVSHCIAPKIYSTSFFDISTSFFTLFTNVATNLEVMVIIYRSWFFFFPIFKDTQLYFKCIRAH